jgi:flagellum-specific peptidoglycan hydrolase FlgJ
MKYCLKIYLKILLPLLFVFFFSSDAKAGVVRNYINKYHKLVEKLSAEYGIPVSVITAISIVESGAGQTKNGKLLNNHFGIVGKNNLLKTKGIKTMFKQYPNAEASFKDFCEMVSRKRYYAKLKGNKSSLLWINAMAKAGYSTQPEVWKKLILNAIKKYNLDE